MGLGQRIAEPDHALSAEFEIVRDAPAMCGDPAALRAAAVVERELRQPAAPDRGPSLTPAQPINPHLPAGARTSASTDPSVGTGDGRCGAIFAVNSCALHAGPLVAVPWV